MTQEICDPKRDFYKEYPLTLLGFVRAYIRLFLLKENRIVYKDQEKKSYCVASGSEFARAKKRAEECEDKDNENSIDIFTQLEISDEKE